MNEKDVFVLTRLGQHQLQGGMTTASADELDLLVRVDGVLTVEQIRAGMRPVPPDFDILFGRLISRGLVQARLDDPFAEQFVFKPSKAALRHAENEADAGTASLQKSGYYVRIARRAHARAPASAQDQLRALVIEDDPHLAKFLQHYLSFEGFDVSVATVREEILAQLRQLPSPDLVLLDVVLPDADGFDILMKMRQHAALKDVPVIMLTAKATREAVIQGLAAGAQGYVTKPFEAHALLEAVRTVMGLPDDPDAAPPRTDTWSGEKPR